MSGFKFRYFAIVASMRTGSNLLERSLAQFGSVARHGELFNPEFIGDHKQTRYLGIDLAQRERDPFPLIEACIASDPRKLHGFRIFPGHDDRVQQRILTDPECGKIILTRDPLETFLSLKIAVTNNKWKLGRQLKRDEVRVDFDPAEYEKYLEDQAELAIHMRGALHRAGQAAFQLKYEDIKNLDVLNGIGAYLGLAEKLSKLGQSTFRQNPGANSEKVSNPPDLPATTPVSATPPQLWSKTVSTRNLILASSLPLAFANIPCGPKEAVLAWMQDVAAVSGGNSDLPPLTGPDLGMLRKWRVANKGAFGFSCVRHPLIRAFDAFAELVMPGGPDMNPPVRRLVARYLTTPMPDSDCRDPEIVAPAFKMFLRFVEQNLRGDTSLRVNPCWASQSGLIAEFSRILPLRVVATEAEWPQAALYLGALLKLGDIPAAAAGNSPNLALLSAVVSDEINALARQAYPEDFAAFGWEDLGA